MQRRLLISEAIRLPKTKVGYKSFHRIIEVSKKLFAENGFLATSTNQIISEAKVAIGTFYIYFDDKRAVYDYLLNDYSKLIRKEIQIAIKDLPTRFEQERQGLKTFTISLICKSFLKNMSLKKNLIILLIKSCVF